MAYSCQGTCYGSFTFWKLRQANKMWYIIQIHKVQILLFCYIDNYIFLCYSLLVSRFFLFQISKSTQVDICDFRGIPAYLPHLIQ